MRCFGFGVDATQQHFVALAERDQFFPGGGALQLGFAHGDHVAQDFDAELCQETLWPARLRATRPAVSRALARSKI